MIKRKIFNLNSAAQKSGGNRKLGNNQRTSVKDVRVFGSATNEEEVVKGQSSLLARANVDPTQIDKQIQVSLGMQIAHKSELESHQKIRIQKTGQLSKYSSNNR